MDTFSKDKLSNTRNFDFGSIRLGKIKQGEFWIV